jgi:membrane associated rhomboid family serine protease
MVGDRPYMRDAAFRNRWSVSVWLIVVNTACFTTQLVAPLLAGVNGGGPWPEPVLDRYLALHPTDLTRGHVWQLLTFQFLHAGPLHLILNCAMLYMFGRPVEDVLGRQVFLRFYLSSGAVGGLLQAACSWVFPGHFGQGPVLGASAGVFALIAAFAALNWDQPITTLIALIIPVTMPAKFLVLVEVVLAGLGLLQGRSGIAHAAHLGGILSGLLYVRFVVLRDSGWFDLSRLRKPLPDRELVKTTSGREEMWARSKKAEFQDLPPGEFISKEVDPILDKISAHGIQSLTPRERKILEAARDRMGRR